MELRQWSVLPLGHPITEEAQKILQDYQPGLTNGEILRTEKNGQIQGTLPIILLVRHCP